jgi:tetratricopeptide (TPR) repeat protein
VFSLATLLYRLLTGKLPYPIEDALPLEAARMLREVPPIMPSEAAPADFRQELLGDVDTILLQGLRKEPERRYPTVAAFADDVQRHLNSEPVMAHADSFGYRAGKFWSRNRSAVIAASVVAVVLIVSAASVIHSAFVARRERNAAERERATAERRLKDMRGLAHSYVFDLDPKLELIPGTVEVRHFVLQNAQKYLEAMSKEVSGDDDLTRETAQGYSRIGQVLATPNMPSMSNYTAADAALSKGVALQRGLVEKHPADLEEVGLLLQQMRHYADEVGGEGDVFRTQQLLLESWEIGKPVQAAGPGARRYPELATIAQSIASNYCGQGDGWDLADPVAALPWIERAEDITNKAVAYFPESATHSAMHSHYELQAVVRAEILMRVGRSAEARPLFLKALELTTNGEQSVYQDLNRKIYRALYAAYLLQIHDARTADALVPNLLADFHEHGNDRALSVGEASGNVLAGRIDLQLGRTALGKSRITKGLGAVEALYKTDPNDAVVSAELAWDLFRAADEPALDHATRKRLYLRAMEVTSLYAKQNPRVLSVAMLLGQCDLGLAELALKEHDNLSSKTYIAAATKEFSKVLAERPVQPEASSLLARAKTMAAS